MKEVGRDEVEAGAEAVVSSCHGLPVARDECGLPLPDRAGLLCEPNDLSFEPTAALLLSSIEDASFTVSL